MPSAARDRLAGLLNTVGVPVPPCVQLNAKASDLRLEVDGIGRIRFPVSAGTARALTALAVPARFGRGAQTLTDTQVRDTWEVPRDLVHAGWTAALDTALDRVREQFGLPPTARLVADLHSLLVYEVGQFFLPHQDSEKHDSMTGTLVVTLPTRHTGGELVIYHEDQSRTHRGWASDLALVAFHADRRHEVRPVTSGYRIALTYNLLIEGETNDPEGESTADDEQLAAFLRQHFTTRVVHRYRDEHGDPPRRLVYLLDHEYTERALDWSRLKGNDISRTARLRAAAAAADAECALALTEVQETWEAYEPEPVYRRHYRDEPDEEQDGDGFELQYLIDSSITLTHWVDQTGDSTSTSLTVSGDEVCASTPSEALQPFSWQYEGYMGNWGNTLDRWYRRGAVVVWPREQGFAMRAEAAPAWALHELLRTVKSGDLAEARTMAATLEPFWDTVALPASTSALVVTALRAAAALEEPALGRMLVRRFRVEQLRPRQMAPLAALAGRYGDAWLDELLTTWFGRGAAWSPAAPDRTTWLASLPALTTALLKVKRHGRTTAARLLELAWDTLHRLLETALAATPPSRRAAALTALGEPLTALLTAGAMIEAGGLRTSVTTFCDAHPADLVECLMVALRAAAELSPDARRRGGFEELAAVCGGELRGRLVRPERAEDDWSLALPDGCSCELCGTLGGFVLDPDRRTLEWPLAQARRHHIHARIDAAELPVSHTTRRVGRPYTLVLAKQARLFDAERQARHRDQRDLDWLAGHWGQDRGVSALERPPLDDPAAGRRRRARRRPG